MMASMALSLVLTIAVANSGIGLSYADDTIPLLHGGSNCTINCTKPSPSGLLSYFGYTPDDAAKADSCISALTSNDTYSHILETSSTSLNTMGYYYQCTHNSSSALSRNRLDFQMCLLDMMDATGSYTIASQGICMPSECTGALIKFVINQLTGPCQIKSSDYMDTCILPVWKLECAFAHEKNETCMEQYKSIKSTVTRAWKDFVDLSSKKNRGEIQFHCGDHQVKRFSAGAIVMLVVAGVLFMLCVASELAEVADRRRINSAAVMGSVNGRRDTKQLLRQQRTDPKTWSLGRKLLKVFCPSDAMAQLMEKTATRQLAGLDGLRAFSMLWIIFAHTCQAAIKLGTDSRNSELLTEASIPQQFTLGASLAIDTFFFLSGLLTTYTLLRRMRKSGKTSFAFAIFVLLRYLRLTPLYAFLMFSYAYVVPMFGSGPAWFRLINEAKACQEHWWTNLLYINNFKPDHFNDSCMPWSWYLACDMQFFVVGLIVLSIYLKFRALGLTVSTVLTIGGVASGWMLLYEHKTDEQDNYFDKPYSRITPFSIGIILGVMLVDHNFVKVYVSKLVGSAMMLGSLAVIIFVVYVDYTNFHPETSTWSHSENATYQSVGRLGYALSISVVTWLCVSNNSRLVNWFLSLGFWEPIGKLTYGAYLVHPIIIRAYYYQQVVLFHYVPFNIFVIFVAMAVISYFIAAALHVMVELPFAGLTKHIILTRGRRY